MLVRSELILGGQRSGKSRRAELLARDWLSQSPGHQAVMVATASAWDDEMAQRIAQHQRDRAERVPRMQTVEEPTALAQAISSHSNSQTLVVVDCLTLWLTNLLMPCESPNNVSKDAVIQALRLQCAMLLIVIEDSAGPVIFVGNEIGLGVIPLGRDTREFVDELGRLNQEVAAHCERVTFMAAGLPLALKGVL